MKSHSLYFILLSTLEVDIGGMTVAVEVTFQLLEISIAWLKVTAKCQSSKIMYDMEAEIHEKIAPTDIHQSLLNIYRD